MSYSIIMGRLQNILPLNSIEKQESLGWPKCHPPSYNLSSRKVTLQEMFHVQLQSPHLGSPWRQFPWFCPPPPNPVSEDRGSALAESFCPALPPPGLNGEHIPGRTKQWQLMTNGLSCPHISLPTPCYHGDISQLKPRDQGISMRDNLMDTGAGGINMSQGPSVCWGLKGDSGDMGNWGLW